MKKKGDRRSLRAIPHSLTLFFFSFFDPEEKHYLNDEALISCIIIRKICIYM